MNGVVPIAYWVSDRIAAAAGWPVAVAWRKLTGSDPRHLGVGLLLVGSAVSMRLSVIAHGPLRAAWSVTLQLGWLATLAWLVRAHDRDNSGGTARQMSYGGFALRLFTLVCVPLTVLDIVRAAVRGDQTVLLLVAGYDLSTLLGLLVILAGDPGGRSVWQQFAERRAPRTVAVVGVTSTPLREWMFCASR